MKFTYRKKQLKRLESGSPARTAVTMRLPLLAVIAIALFTLPCLNVGANETNNIPSLKKIVVEAAALSKYRPATVNGATFTDVAPEKVPVVVDTLTDDFIREHNPTDLHDLLRYVPGIETGGKSLLIRQPGTFTIRGKGGSSPMFDGLFPIGSGAGLFMDPFVMERIEVVKGPIGSLNGGSGAVQNASGGGGSINLYLKSANLEKDEINLQANTSIGKYTFRQRGMADANETFLDGKAAVRVVASADYYEPAYIHEGSQNGARARESFTVAPSVAFKPSDKISFGVKSLFQYTDQPSYIGVPVWRGRPGGGYSWYESSCRRGDRSEYESFMVNPWVDWQVNDDWLLKFGASLMVNSWSQTTREPYAGTSGTGGPMRQRYLREMQYFYNYGVWPVGIDNDASFYPAAAPSHLPWPLHNKYMLSGFSKSHQVNRTYNLFIRSIYDKDIWRDVVKNSLVVQPDFYYRESSGGFGTPVARYGLTLQDAVTWEWFTLLGGVRYDHFEQEAYTSNGKRFTHIATDAVSPRGGLSIQPLEWLVFFGNISQTRTPMLGLRNTDGSTPKEIWRSTQYEGGLRLRPAEKLWLTVSAYRIEEENRPEMDNTGLVTGHDGRNTSRGAEASLTGDITDDWTVMAMYAFNKYTDRNVAPGNPGRDFERVPQHTFSLNTSYRFSSGFLEDVVIGGGYRFRSMSYATMRGSFVHKNLRFDPSHVFDINVSMPLSKFGGSDNWIVSFGVRNLFGEKYFESSRHFYECLVGEPRTFEICIRAKF